METGSSFGEGYMASYAEIPNSFVQEEGIAIRKLSGHLRLFDPQDFRGALVWYQENYEALCVAYGRERVDEFVLNMTRTFGIAGKDKEE